MRFAMISTSAGPAVVTLASDGAVRGRKLGAGVVSLDEAIQGGQDMAALGASLLGGQVFQPGEFTFLPLLAKPGKIICVGLNYADHTKESPYEQPAYPTIFGRFNSSLVGHDQPLIRPLVSEEFDYEGEMVAIIGKSGRHIPKARATSHVMGYSLFNDASVRDYQFKSPQWTVGKNFDGSGAFGPWLVTADELPDGAAGLKIETRLNGQTVQSSNTADMVFNIADLVSILSQAFTLDAGDIIVSGTPSGVGFARNPKLFMKHGDVCEVEIEKIGVLRNPIADEKPVA